MQKKNVRNTPPVVPRKLALLVAAAMASAPAYPAIFSFSTYFGSTSAGDYSRHMKIDSAGYAHVVQVNAMDGATTLILRKFDPATGASVYDKGYGLRSGTCVAGMVLGTDSTPYVAITLPSSAEQQSCDGGPLGTKGDVYVFHADASGVIDVDYTLAGSTGEQATGIEIDGAGNIYVAGNTRSSNFPATVGSYQGGTDAFVAKFSPGLALDMAVLLGGAGDDIAGGLTVDATGNIYVGMGSSLVKLGSDGALQHTTSLSAGDFISAVAMSSTGPVASGTRFGAVPAPDVFLARVTPAGEVLDYQTIGATGSEVARGMTVAGDSIYVSGETFSETFPNVATPLVGASGGSDAFVARIGPDGLEYSTRFGGTDDEFAASVAVAPNGDVYVMGTSYSTDFPTVGPRRSLPGGANDLFLARLATEFDMAAPSVGIASDVGTQAIRITRTGSLAGAASVKWTAVNGTAVAGTHYGTSAVAPSGTVNFAAGQGSVLLHVGTTVSGPNTIRINPLGNFATPRTFSVALSNPTGGPLVGSVASTSVTISQGVSGLQLQSNAVSVLENAGTVQVRVDRAPGSALVPATVNYATANVTALAGAHYTTRTGTLTWAAGDAEPKFISVPIIDNTAANASRSFRVNLSGPTGAPILGSAFATVTILDQDNTIALASASQIVSEGAPSVTLQVRRTGSPTLPASVSWTTENVTALAGSDFGASGDPAALTGTLNWDAGDLTVRNIVIPVLDDATPEIAKTFKVNLSGVSNATLGVASTTITLNDNERGFAFQSPEYTVAEGQPSVVLTVRRLGPATSMATVTWTASSGTATAGLDFAPSPTQRSGTLTWAIGDATSKTITIPIVDDSTVGEPAETFTVSLSTNTAGHVITEPGIATVTINENDLEPETSIQFGQPKYLVVENAGTVTLEVTRTDLGLGYGRQSQVSYATQPGTALATSDYATKSGTLVWTPGDTAPKQITVNIVNDAIAEPPETFRVVLSGANAGTKLGATMQASVTILDDDEKFPPHGAIPAGFSVPVDATHGWHVAGDAGAYEGVYALKSDEIDDGETAAIEMEGNFAGNASFRVRISSEPGFDVLRFYVDGVLQTTWSGTAIAGWQMSPSYPLNGHHVLRWEYVKDGSISIGQDAAFIDALVTPGFTP